MVTWKTSRVCVLRNLIADCTFCSTNVLFFLFSFCACDWCAFSYAYVTAALFSALHLEEINRSGDINEHNRFPHWKSKRVLSERSLSLHCRSQCDCQTAANPCWFLQRVRLSLTSWPGNRRSVWSFSSPACVLCSASIREYDCLCWRLRRCRWRSRTASYRSPSK